MHAILGATGLELHFAVNQRKHGVVFAKADVFACVIVGAALANDDVASDNRFTAETLHAEALGLRVATVTGRAACFLMCPF